MFIIVFFHSLYSSLFISPPIESKNMRYGMVNEHKDLIGPTRAFDGTILFLPIKITEDVRHTHTHYTSNTRHTQSHTVMSVFTHCQSCQTLSDYMLH